MLTDVAEYYDARLSEHGETPRGVDWNGYESQLTRFLQLTKIIGCDQIFSLNDLGCGYGALLDVLIPRYPGLSYYGYDVSREMIESAKVRNSRLENASFSVGSEPDQMADYGIASGIFNVKMDYPDNEWLSYILHTLDTLNSTSNKGFSFNCLTLYSDSHMMRDHLYYADPRAIFDFCIRNYSRNVALLHDYGLFEFTVLVKKST